MANRSSICSGSSSRSPSGSSNTGATHAAGRSPLASSLPRPPPPAAGSEHGNLRLQPARLPAHPIARSGEMISDAARCRFRRAGRADFSGTGLPDESGSGGRASPRGASEVIGRARPRPASRGVGTPAAYHEAIGRFRSLIASPPEAKKCLLNGVHAPLSGYSKGYDHQRAFSLVCSGGATGESSSA
jgi:hypothetical protein